MIHVFSSFDSRALFGIGYQEGSLINDTSSLITWNGWPAQNLILSMLSPISNLLTEILGRGLKFSPLPKEGHQPSAMRQDRKGRSVGKFFIEPRGRSGLSAEGRLASTRDRWGRRR